MEKQLIEEMRARLPEYVKSITKEDRRAGRNMYVCPLCGSGTGKGKGQKNGAFSVKNSMWHCFACDRGGDVYDLIGAYKGYSEFKDQLKEAADFFGYYTADTTKRQEPTATKPRTQVAVKPPEIKAEQQNDESITAYIKQCAAQMPGSAGAEYMKKRGFTVDTIKTFRIGYDASKNGVVIPYPNNDYYIIRVIGKEGSGKYLKPAGITEPLFITGNPGEGLFVCEGQLDALSLLQAGAAAVAAIGGGGARKLETLDGVKRAVIVSDRDEAGEKTGERIAGVLKEKGVSGLIAQPPEGYKDSNDLLRADAEKLAELVTDWKKQLAQQPQPAQETPLPFQTHNVSEYVTGGIYEKDIAYFKKYKDRKTGFAELDKYLTLYPGLAALGGASSLGKTTFCVNLTDRLLKRGETVLYFTLEQLPIELITKSFARMLIEKDPLTRLTNTDIKNGATSDALEAVKKEYAENSKNYRIITGNFRTTANDISDYVEDFIKQNDGLKPIVIIDYLQLIAPPVDFRGGVREYTDENIKTLKDMQKKNGLFVIMVSNFNRASNNEPVSYESFKETSMIEYTCDYIWGLQLAIMDAENTGFYVTTGSRGGEKESTVDRRRRMIQEAQQKNPKEVQFVSLKNRNGKQFFKVNFYYQPQYDLYTEENDFVPVSNDEDDNFTPFDM